VHHEIGPRNVVCELVVELVVEHDLCVGEREVREDPVLRERVVGDDEVLEEVDLGDLLLLLVARQQEYIWVLNAAPFFPS
jgi:hypothetical protein